MEIESEQIYLIKLTQEEAVKFHDEHIDRDDTFPRRYPETYKIVHLLHTLL